MYERALQEEIRGEGLARAIEPFSRFLTIAGLSNGEQLNFAAIGNDAQVPARTVREYYQVLEDTLVGHLLPAYQKTVKRKPVATAKFYWFDLGVANTLARRSAILAGSIEYGQALEHQVFLELRAYLDYRRRRETLHYWRSSSQIEVDFVVGDAVAIEVKATGRVRRKDVKGLLALKEEVRLKRLIMVANERTPRHTDEGVEVWPLDELFHELWADRLIP